MKNRKVKIVSFGEMVDMGGFPVRQPLPSHYLPNLDPFLLVHHANIHIEPGTHPLQAGVGPHPHRGFSPVTFIFKGGVHHRDSRGNSSIVYEGGVQWMNSGLGMIHSERPPKELAEKGGEQELIQLWVNTPRRYKMEEPSYQAITAEDTPVFTSIDEKAVLKLVCGEFEGKRGPVSTYTPVIALTCYFKEGSSYQIPLPASYSAFCYLLDGKLEIAGYGMIEANNLVAFDNDGEGISIKAIENTRFIVLAGEPLHEPVEAYGPFVMSNQTEIMEAMRDYRMGKMGFLMEDELQ